MTGMALLGAVGFFTALIGWVLARYGPQDLAFGLVLGLCLSPILLFLF